MLQLSHKRVLVAGLARSGVAAANLLLSKGARVRVTDLKPAGELREQLSRLQGKVETTLGGHRVEDFLNTDLIVLSPGVPSDIRPLREARSEGIAMLPEVELGFHFLDGPLIGVTGSNGKTTTTTLIGEMFESAGSAVAVAGNIGTPLSEIALLRPESVTTSVVELSSFQLEMVQQFQAGIALVLNISPDHLDRHESLESYVDAKRRILLTQRAGDWAVLNADDPVTFAMKSRTRGRACLFSRRPLKQGICVEAGHVIARLEGGEETLLPVSEIAIRGQHNLENVLAAAAAAFLSGIPGPAVAQAVRDFKGVEHRLERVADVDGVSYYNDSKATNVDSARRALESFSGPIVLIMGGLDKGGDFRRLEGLVKERVRGLILIGSAAGKIKNALGRSTVVSKAKDLEEAVEQASRCALPGDAVLLAPGCASFDMFRNYEHRGRVFKESVARIPHHRDRSS